MIRPDAMETDMHGHPLSSCAPVADTDSCSNSHLCVCLELSSELPFTLDHPHDGLNHLWCGALTPDISCVQLQEKNKQKNRLLTNMVQNQYDYVKKHKMPWKI